MAYINVISCDRRSFNVFSGKGGSPSFVSWTDSRYWVDLNNGGTPDSVSIRRADSTSVCPGVDTRIVFGCKLRIREWHTNNWDFIYIGSNFTLRLEASTNDLLVLNSALGTVRRITAPFSLNTEYRLEFSVFLSDENGGNAEVWIDGTSQGYDSGFTSYNGSASALNIKAGDAISGDLSVRAIYMASTASDRMGTWDCADLANDGTGFTTGGTALDTGSWANVAETPENSSNAANYNSSASAKSGWAQFDGTGASFDGPSGRGFQNDPVAWCAWWNNRKVEPVTTYYDVDSILVQTNYTGSVTDIDDDPDSPDANALVASGGIGVFRGSFPTPTSGVNNVLQSNIRVAVSAQGAAGGNETIVPDSITSNTNFGTNITDIDEDADSPDGSVIAPTGDDGVLQVSTGNPTSTNSLNTGTDAQTVKVVLGKYDIGVGLDAGGADPTFDLYIYDGASQHEQVATGVSVTGTQQTFTYNWTASGLSDPDNIRVHLVTTSNGGGPNKRSIAVDTINVDLVFSETTLNGELRLYDAGTQKTPVQTFTVAPSEGNKVITLQFDSADLTSADGSGIEAYLTQTDSSPSDYIDIEAVELTIVPNTVSLGIDCYLGNNTDGVTIVRTLPSPTTSLRSDGQFNQSATVLPTKSEYGRAGFGLKAGETNNISIAEIWVCALYNNVSTGYELDAATGSYAITGQAADLQRKLRLQCATGSYLVYGPAADLNRLYELDAATGSYSVSGVNADLQVAEVMQADFGTYALTGQAVELQRTLRLQVDTGSYAISGQDADLEKSIFFEVDVGSYALTGQTADLDRTYHLDAATGSYAIGGEDAALNRTFYLGVDTGAYSIAGQAADLQRQLVIQFETGSYAVSGVAADLRVAEIIQTDFGTYLLTGEAANLARQLPILAATGSYAISGQDAALNKGYYLGAETGSYSVSGVTVNLLAGRELAAEVGAYSVAGAAADLKAGEKINLDAGSYAITGQPAALQRQLRLQVDTGSYSYSGQAAELSRGYQVDADTGTYSISGVSAELPVNRHLAAETGAYSITGVAADLQTEGDLACDTGGYNINGQAAELQRQLRLQVDSGSYSVNGQAAELNRLYTLDAATGSYVITGSSVELDRLLTLEAEIGNYAINGVSANLNYSGGAPRRVIVIG